MRLRADHRGVLLLLCGMVTTSASFADVVTLATGGVIEGEIIESTEESVRIQTVVGVVTLRRADIAEIVEKPSVFDEYQTRLQQTADTAPEQFALAAWCEQNSMHAQRKQHLRNVLRLDPDHPGARAALGYVRVGELWVEARSTPQTPPPAPEPQQQADRVAAAQQAQLYRQIRGIRSTLLDAPLKRLQSEGRRKILALTDPLAIVPLVEVLSQGQAAARRVLIEALSAFDLQDEATMNLAVLALVEPVDELRETALQELKRRSDVRVIAHLRRALRSNNDQLVRRAAVALGALRALDAVPDLIDNLTVERRKLVEVPVNRYYTDWQTIYQSPHHLRPRVPSTGIAVAGDLLRVQTELELREVVVFRTEVLEALRSITGQNLGFDAAQWRRWRQEQQP